MMPSGATGGPSCLKSTKLEVQSRFKRRGAGRPEALLPFARYVDRLVNVSQHLQPDCHNEPNQVSARGPESASVHTKQQCPDNFPINVATRRAPGNSKCMQGLSLLTGFPIT